jgi:hypothetical protein
MGKIPMNSQELEIVIGLLFYFSYYNKGPAEICFNPENFPKPAELIARLQGATKKEQQD